MSGGHSSKNTAQFGRDELRERRAAAAEKRRAQSVLDCNDQDVRELPAKKPKIETIEIDSDTTDDEARGVLTVSSAKPASQGKKVLRFASGFVGLTFVKGFPKEPHHLTLDELLDRKRLRMASLSTFDLDLEWFLSKLDFGETIVWLTYYPVGSGATESQAAQAIAQGASSLQRLGIRLHSPPMPRTGEKVFGAMHSKLQLLFFDDFLRVVVPSANLRDFDWGETGIMQNVFYVHDFALRTPDTDRKTTDFEVSLKSFCRRLQYPAEIRDALDQYDFSTAAGVQFLATVKGFSQGEERFRSGLTGLAWTSHKLTGAELGSGSFTIDFHASSIGDLSKQGFMRNLLRAARGVQLTPTVRKGAATQEDVPLEDLRVIYPSNAVVRQSITGDAGTTFMKPDFWTKQNFPRNSFYDYMSERKGVLSHAKIMLVRSKQGGRGYAYVGSANLSPSAWGESVTENKGERRIHCSNYESGVLIPLDMIEGRLPYQTGVYLTNDDPWLQ
ncbi:hypothetical protein PYCC9005_000517 [Savitreella phatthalungensis]